ncbi:MAG: glycosyltransferase family 39 protein [Cyanobacteria bacterium P01_A01_bin.45]
MIISSSIAAIAIVSPPNNWDSMTYHMSRVIHWMQNRSVAHYQTYIVRQVDTPPLAGFIITHLQILSRSDRFANLVQWFSMLGSMVAVSLIAKRLGANLYGQLTSAMICLTIPMGILQASNTQNDYVVSFWLACFVYYTLGFLVDSSKNRSKTFNLGASLGLAIFTKATAYIYAFPFCVWLSVSTLRQKNLQSFKKLIAIALFTAAINISHWYKNILIWGTPFGVSGNITKNELFTFPAISSNLIRNLALHFVTVYQQLNIFVEHLIIFIHHNFLGLNVSDSRTTFLDVKFSMISIPSMIFHEDTAGNLVHIILIFFSIAIYFVNKKWKDNYTSLFYLISLISTFIIFNTLLKWQPWASRLHLPLFVLFSAFLGYTISTFIKDKKHLYNYLLSLLIILSLPYIIFNSTRPILKYKNLTILPKGIFVTDREELYFASQRTLQQTYIEVVKFLNDHSCKKVGLVTGGDVPEYPLLIMLLSQDNKIDLRHFFLQDKQNKNFQPCAIVSIQFDNEEYIAPLIKDYNKSWTDNLVNIKRHVATEAVLTFFKCAII